MITDRIEGKWIDLFAEVFARCKVAAQEPCAVLSESQSRALNVQLAELALRKLGARPFHVVVPTPRQSAPVPIRSTGASTVLQGLGPAIGALAAASFVADCTVEGLMHAPELPQILKGGARVLYISDEHPDVLERLAPSPADEQKVRAGMRRLKDAKRMHVTSPAGTELEILVEGATVGGVWGDTEKPGTPSHRPFRPASAPLHGGARRRRRGAGGIAARVARWPVLHGLGGGHAAWNRQVEHFGRRGYSCIAWDQPGYGGTPPVEPYTLQTVTDALKRHMDRDRVVLIGQSMGGFVAQEMYARFPDRIAALVLAFTSPAFGGGGSQFVRQFVAARIGPLDEGKTMAQVANALMPSMRGTKSDPEGLAHAERIMSAIPPETYRKAVQMLTTFDRKDQLEKIVVPTLLVAGSDDRIAPYSVMQSMARRIPHAEFVLLEGCGHLGPMDQPQAFNGALEKFLQHHSL